MDEICHCQACENCTTKTRCPQASGILSARAFARHADKANRPSRKRIWRLALPFVASISTVRLFQGWKQDSDSFGITKFLLLPIRLACRLSPYSVRPKQSKDEMQKNPPYRLGCIQKKVARKLSVAPLFGHVEINTYLYSRNQ